MNETIQVKLDSRLVESLKTAAAEKGVSVDETVENLIAEYLNNLRHEQLLAEMNRFRAQHAELLKLYRREFIGMYEGRVLDHDPDDGVLYTRLSQRYGDLPILVVEVAETPEQEIIILSPRLEPVE